MLEGVVQRDVVALFHVVEDREDAGPQVAEDVLEESGISIHEVGFLGVRVPEMNQGAEDGALGDCLPGCVELLLANLENNWVDGTGPRVDGCTGY